MDRNIKLQLSVLASIVILALSSCGGGTTTSQSTPEQSDGVVRVIADDTQKFDQERYTASPGVVEIEYIFYTI